MKMIYCFFTLFVTSTFALPFDVRDVNVIAPGSSIEVENLNATNSNSNTTSSSTITIAPSSIPTSVIPFVINSTTTVLVSTAIPALPTLALNGNSVPASTSSNPVVTTEFGSWVGHTNHDEIDSFLGIPYALPPIGNLRFAPPQADTRVHGSFSAGQHGFSCPQMGIINGLLPGVLNEIGEDLFDFITSIPILQGIASTNQSEDCLTINIQRPANTAANAKLSVFVWIFGGGFLWGGSSLYNFNSLAKRSIEQNQPTIFVSFNYRVNSFGFLPGRQVRDDPSTSVNAGLLDQRLALEWVADNIANFGGDPDKVTVAGESAGAISIGFLLMALGGDISYKGKNLLRAAIMESGSPVPVEGEIRGQNSFDVVAKGTDCYNVPDAIGCLRSKTWQEIQTATNLLPGIFSPSSLALSFLPRTDGKYLKVQAQVALAAGDYAHVPILSGDQYDEGSLLAIGTLGLKTNKDVSNWLATNWFPNASSSQIDSMMTLYPQDPTKGSPFDTGFFNVLTPQNKRINAMVGDFVFQSCRRSTLTVLQTTQPVWSYVSRVFHPVPILGSFHFSDILSVFGYLPTDPSREVQSRWIAFTNVLDPNVAGYTFWPQYGTAKNLIQFSELGSKIIVDNFREVAIAFWTSISSTLAF